MAPGTSLSIWEEKSFREEFDAPAVDGTVTFMRTQTTAVSFPMSESITG